MPSATTSAGTPSSATPSATATASVPVSTPSSPTAEQTPSVSASPTASAPTAARKAEAESAAEKAIRERHARLGGDKGRLGARVGSTICGLRDGGCYQRFRSGSIYWTKKTGADPIWGSIQSRWRELKSEHGRLGYPTDSEKCGLRDGGCYQRFQGGSIYWSQKSGAYPIWGSMYARWSDLKWERGRLGYPTGSEKCGLRDGGCYQRFQGGSIYWSQKSGAQPVWGSMYSRWSKMKWERGRLGYPISAEKCGLRNGGCYQKFQGGSMHWSQKSGAWPTWGSIARLWAREGSENGNLAYPTGMEKCGRSSCEQNFQNGSIVWTKSSDKSRSRYRLNESVHRTRSSEVKYTMKSSGCPVGLSRLRTIEMNYLNFDGDLKRGMIIVREDTVGAVVDAFQIALDNRYPIARMDNPDKWRADDEPMMAANNTSAFNCRHVTGNPQSMSPHSYGTAIDVNTVQNPFRDSQGRWLPSNGRKYVGNAGLNRKVTHPAMLVSSSPLTDALEDRGYFWGGRWTTGRDWQHFER
ncbi:M15 family metallopeptidase [Naumannella halotolerans]|uniref:M15 family metallopeptidase n=1 Tax=Naumannella halotolerans TaxID=993414 RepID=UPI00105BA6C1|nr:M15 family metallopeptidase [Naumannella halotolerans]